MTPTAIIMASTSEAISAMDGLGRRISLRRLTALDMLRLFKAAGPDLAQNQAWLGMAMLASSVTAIDDVPIPVPVNEFQIEAMVNRLGDDGISAVAEALQPESSADDPKQVTHAGNLPGTPT